MAEYRAFRVERDGHLGRYEPLVCDSDGEAITQAKALLDGHDIEVWSGARLVIHLKREVSPEQETSLEQILDALRKADKESSA